MLNISLINLSLPLFVYFWRRIFSSLPPLHSRQRWSCLAASSQALPQRAAGAIDGPRPIHPPANSAMKRFFDTYTTLLHFKAGRNASYLLGSGVLSFKTPFTRDNPHVSFFLSEFIYDMLFAINRRPLVR